MPKKNSSSSVAASRARRRELGMRSMEAVFFEGELAALDKLKSQLKLTSRSEVLRLLLAKTDPDTLTPDDAATLRSDAV